jgi:hypothetical protein
MKLKSNYQEQGTVRQGNKLYLNNDFVWNMFSFVVAYGLFNEIKGEMFYSYAVLLTSQKYFYFYNELISKEM